jgi:hypothetical protein
LCTIGFSGDKIPQVFPGFAQIRLWNDTIKQLGYNIHAMQRVWHKEDKYTLFLPNELTTEFIPLHAIYLLNPADTQEVFVESLGLSEKLKSLLDNVFRAEYVKGLGVQETLEPLKAAMVEWDPDGQGTWCKGSVGLGHLMLHTTPESLNEQLPATHPHHPNLSITADARIDNRDDISVN